jgi:hypothetical protein
MQGRPYDRVSYAAYGACGEESRWFWRKSTASADALGQVNLKLEKVLEGFSALNENLSTIVYGITKGLKSWVSWSNVCSISLPLA